MPKRIVKLCKICGKVHDFRRSWWKQAKRGGYDICWKWQLGTPQPMPTAEELVEAIRFVREMCTWAPDRN